MSINFIKSKQYKYNKNNHHSQLLEILFSRGTLQEQRRQSKLHYNLTYFLFESKVTNNNKNIYIYIQHGLSIEVTNRSDSKSLFFGAEFDPNGHKNCEKNI